MRYLYLLILASTLIPNLCFGLTVAPVYPDPNYDYIENIYSSIGQEVDVGWEEEAIEDDGSILILNRRYQYNWSKNDAPALIMTETINFSLTANGQIIQWQQKGVDYRGNLLVLSVNVVNGIPYVVTQPLDDSEYFHKGCPNPAYVIFQYIHDEWVQISMNELPLQIKQANVIVLASPKVVFKLSNHYGKITVPEVKKINDQIFDLTTGYATRVFSREQLDIDESMLCGMRPIYHGALFTSTRKLEKLEF